MGCFKQLLDDCMTWRLCLAKDLDASRSDQTVQHLDRMVRQWIEWLVFRRLARRSEESNAAWQNATPEVLGRIHERMIENRFSREDGEIRVKPNRQSQKSGSIYYTPKYVVDYIVRNSLGVWLHEKTPEQAKRLTVVDPACGCGFFLLAAHDYLIDWFCKQYVKRDPWKYPKRLCQTSSGEWRLTDTERLRIARRSLFGVDLDAEAVEITLRSLWLNCGQRASDPRSLAPLRSNIQCGNALIGTDLLDTNRGQAMTPEALNRVRLFDWDEAFPNVFRGENQGFHFVIGNPPYHRERDEHGQLDLIAKTPFGKRYRSPRMDLWYYFVHRSLQTLLRKGGTLSFITNAYWTSGTGASRLIQQLRDEAHLAEIFHLEKLPVFAHVTGQHTIFRIENKKSERPTRVKRVSPGGPNSAESLMIDEALVVSFDKTSRQLFRHGKLDLEPPADALLEKLEAHSPLATMGQVRQGIAENPALINVRTNERFGRRWRVGEGVFALMPDERRRLTLSDDEHRLFRPYHGLCDLGRYWIAERASRTLLYSTKQTCPDINTHASIRNHLQRFRPIMESRRETRLGRIGWWHLHWPRNESLWRSTKIIALQMAKRPSFVAATRPVYVPFSTNVWVPFESTDESVHYISALLNSRLMMKWFQHHAKRRGVGLEINGHVLSQAPIRKIDFDSSNERETHDQIAAAAEQLIALNHWARTGQVDVAHGRRIQHLERLIDKRVYVLYGLTEAEIEKIEAITPSCRPSRKKESNQ